MRRSVLIGMGLIAAMTSVKAQGTATLVVIATDRASREPLAYADVAIERLRREMLASPAGMARLTGLPLGTSEVRVRRVGYAPLRRTITLTGNDTLRVALDRLAITLAAMKSTDEVCPGREGGDTTTLTVIEQMRLNADRSRLLAEAYPFSMRFERMMSDEGRTRRRFDTLVVSGMPLWDYAPGKLVVRANDPVDPNPDRLLLPQLVHLASDEFLQFHCFRYLGREKVDGVERLRLAFEPIRTLREPDFRGSAYLDTATFRLVGTVMIMDRSVNAATDMNVRVESRYLEILPGVSVAQQICARTTVVRRFGTSPPGAGLEWQRLLAVDFNSTSPGTPTVGVAPSCRR